MQLERSETGPRLRSLELMSSVPLARMKEFYQQRLGLSIAEEQRDRLTIRAGQTQLTFVTAGPTDGKPFYHFAFNIPENKIQAAWEWQRQRSPLLPISENQRDGDYPDDIVNYSHWNAHAIFFFDPSGNVVEYIARHDLKNAASGPFVSDDILYASEIAWVVDDVLTTAERLKEVVGMEQYRDGSEQFMALGDEQGLLLLMQRGRIISFDSPETKAVEVFPTTATVRGLHPTKYVFPQYPYTILVE
jgi:hypothetical protein